MHTGGGYVRHDVPLRVHINMYAHTYNKIFLLKDTYIVDNCGNTIWVWLGKKASKKERIDAIRNAHGFVKKKNYTSHIPVCRVIEGGEPIEFKLLFSSWREEDANNNNGNVSNGET